MRIAADIADGFVRKLDEAEDADPGHYLAFDEVMSIIRDLDSSTTDPVLIAEMLVELEHRDWIESKIKGHLPTDNSVRITAKGQNRAASSQDYAEHFRRAVDSLPVTPESELSQSDDAPSNSSQFGVGAFGAGPFAGPSISPSDSTHTVTSSSPTISPRFESKRWTGTQFVLIDREVLEEVRAKATELHMIIQAMHFPSNSESQDIKGLADALVAICSMAEPEVSVLDRILASPKFKSYAALFGIVATIRGAIGI